MVVDPAQEHGLRAHDDAAVGDDRQRALDLGGDLPRVREVHGKEVRAARPQGADEPRGDPLRQVAGHARADADDLDVRDGPEPADDRAEGEFAQEQGIAAADEDVADFRMGGDVLRGRLDAFRGGAQVAVADQPAARAVPAVGGAAVRGHEQHPVRIAMHQARGLHVVIFAAGVFHVRRGDDEFLDGGDDLAADRAIGVVALHERDEMGRRRDGEFLARDGEAVRFLAAEGQNGLEILQSPQAMGQLPAPIVPLFRGGVEGLPSDKTGRGRDRDGPRGRGFFQDR